MYRNNKLNADNVKIRPVTGYYVQAPDDQWVKVSVRYIDRMIKPDQDILYIDIFGNKLFITKNMISKILTRGF